MIRIKKIYTLCFLLTAISCKEVTYRKAIVSTKKNEQKDYQTYWKKVDNYYFEQIQHATSLLDTLEKVGLHNKQTKIVFKKMRAAFKKAEPFAGVLNPETTHRANGPALPIYKDDSGRIIPPLGLQKLEETIYDKTSSLNDFKREIHIQKGLFTKLQQNILKRKLNPQRFFVATHQQLMRIISLAMAGFDTPVSQLSIKETVISLESLFYVYSNSIRFIINDKEKLLDSTFEKNIKEAINYIHENSDFILFDRFTFIRDYLNPITRNWVEIRKKSGLWEGSKSFAFNFDAPTFFENNSFNKYFFAKTNNRNPSEAVINLGKKLFFDKNISAKGDMSCATCHLASKGYADGLKFGKNNSGNLLTRNTPTLLNSNFQKAFFWDGRSTTLEDQITGVFKNKDEFNSNTHQFSDKILKDTSYVKEFKNVFGKIPHKNIEIIKAISSYVATLNSFDSKFDKNIRGEESTFTPDEKLGFNLFMGKALCATCHFIPLTNGTVPPFFTETEKEIIGVPNKSDNRELDEDLGFYSVYKEESHKGMFKTPSVRNMTLTAPYMHNGVYNTLEEVIEFYNLGGGAGLGFDLEHQTLPFDELKLDSKEKTALISFLKTLTDSPY